MLLKLAGLSIFVLIEHPFAVLNAFLKIYSNNKKKKSRVKVIAPFGSTSYAS